MDKECYDIFSESAGSECHRVRLVVIRGDDHHEFVSYKFEYQKIGALVETVGEARAASDIAKMLPPALQEEAWAALNAFHYEPCLSMSRQPDAVEREYSGL